MRCDNKLNMKIYLVQKKKKEKYISLPIFSRGYLTQYLAKEAKQVFFMNI